MAIRWYICPVIEIDLGDGRSYRYPKIKEYGEPGTDDGEGNLAAYSRVGNAFSQNPGAGKEDLYLLKVIASDFTPLENDPDITDVFDYAWNTQNDEVANMESTPRDLGWNQGRVNRIKNRLARNGVNTSGWTRDTPLGEMLDAFGAIIDPAFKPSRAKVGK